MTGPKNLATIKIVGSVRRGGAPLALPFFCIVEVCAFPRREDIRFSDVRKTGGLCPPMERTVFDQWKRSRIKNCAVS